MAYLDIRMGRHGMKQAPSRHSDQTGKTVHHYLHLYSLIRLLQDQGKKIFRAFPIPHIKGGQNNPLLRLVYQTETFLPGA